MAKLNREQREQLAIKAIELQGQIGELSEQLDMIKAVFRKLQSEDYGSCKVIVTASSRFDATIASEVLDEQALEDISVTKPDARLARNLLAPAMYAQCQKAGSANVRFA